MQDEDVEDIGDQEIPQTGFDNQDDETEENVPEDEEVIDEEDIPLEVIEEEEPVDIEDDTLPLAGPTEEGTRIWWSWIPVIGAIASAVEGYRRNKLDKEEASDKKD